MRPTRPPRVERTGPSTVADGIWQLRVPIPENPLGFTLVYAIETADGPVLVDAGWPHEDSWDALVAGMEAMGSSVADVVGVLVTHFHPDHHGLSGRVREESGAWVAMHPADAQVITEVRNEDPGSYGRRWLTIIREAGAEEADIAALSENQGRTFRPPAVPNRLLAHGDLAPVRGRDVRIHHTPGHTPGHVCLHLEPSGALLTGDHLLPKISPHISTWRSDGDPLGEYMGSLRGIRDIDADVVLPAHIRHFRGHRERIDELLDHHDTRLDELRDQLADGQPRSLWQLAEGMTWNRGWGGLNAFSKTLALAEAEAHVRHLATLGEITRVAGDVVSYARTTPGT